VDYILCCFIVLTGKIEVSFIIHLELGYFESYCCMYMVYMFVWPVHSNTKSILQKIVEKIERFVQGYW
jgi:hypothetical protein